ncbi:hypothetical protein B0J11DRAFT_124434 [Dendryphion nanum]|uniref:Uncharacterized protein n=1 Tax=Dendryphion nanum TaxID=256645 RepID=A0A9P9D9A3_9PLEO|nr:hypothetical protein B0J11DRAFT_124434 [Dendryphion nanum]
MWYPSTFVCHAPHQIHQSPTTAPAKLRLARLQYIILPLITPGATHGRKCVFIASNPSPTTSRATSASGCVPISFFRCKSQVSAGKEPASRLFTPLSASSPPCLPCTLCTYRRSEACAWLHRAHRDRRRIEAHPFSILPLPNSLFLLLEDASLPRVIMAVLKFALLARLLVYSTLVGITPPPMRIDEARGSCRHLPVPVSSESHPHPWTSFTVSFPAPSALCATGPRLL